MTNNTTAEVTQEIMSTENTQETATVTRRMTKPTKEELYEALETARAQSADPELNSSIDDILVRAGRISPEDATTTDDTDEV